MTHQVYDIPMEFIENSIQIGIKLANGEAKTIDELSPYGNDLKNLYFVGQGLCLDVKDAIGSADVITLSWDKETFGFFSGGPRRLLSLPALRGLQELMDLCEINYEPKEMLP